MRVPCSVYVPPSEVQDLQVQGPISAGTFECGDLLVRGPSSAGT